MSVRKGCVLGTIVTLAMGVMIALNGCGSNSPTGPRPKKDGRIYWDNTTGSRIKVEYYNDDMGKLIQSVVEPRTKEDVGQTVLKGGTKVTLKWDVGNTLWGSVEVTVDNNVTVKVTGFRDPNTDPKNRMIYVLLAG